MIRFFKKCYTQGVKPSKKGKTKIPRNYYNNTKRDLSDLFDSMVKINFPIQKIQMLIDGFFKLQKYALNEQVASRKIGKSMAISNKIAVGIIVLTGHIKIVKLPKNLETTK